MRSRWTLCALLVARRRRPSMRRNVLATPATGFTGTTLAKATYGDIFSQVHTVPATWNEHIQTKGDSDLYVQQNTWQPGGEHRRLAHASGAELRDRHAGQRDRVRRRRSDLHAARVHGQHSATTRSSTPGDGHVHIIRNETSTVAQTIAVQLVPAGATRREDVSDPGNCTF